MKKEKKPGEHKNAVQKCASETSSRQMQRQASGYYEMYEYFCSGHDDIAVAVVQYDSSGRVVSRKDFSWANGCNEVTAEGIWREAHRYAEKFVRAGLPQKTK